MVQPDIEGIFSEYCPVAIQPLYIHVRDNFNVAHVTRDVIVDTFVIV